MYVTWILDLYLCSVTKKESDGYKNTSHHHKCDSHDCTDLDHFFPFVWNRMKNDFRWWESVLRSKFPACCHQLLTLFRKFLLFLTNSEQIPIFDQTMYLTKLCRTKSSFPLVWNRMKNDFRWWGESRHGMLRSRVITKFPACHLAQLSKVHFMEMITFQG